MMYYIIENDKIILSDNDLEKLKNTIQFLPQYSISDIKETDREIVNNVFTDTTEYLNIKREELLNQVSEIASSFEQVENHDMYITSSIGFRVNADQKALRNIDVLINLNVTAYRDYDNVNHNVTIDDLKIIKSEIEQNAMNLYQQKWAYQDLINNAETIESLNSIEVNFKMLDLSLSNVSETTPPLGNEDKSLLN